MDARIGILNRELKRLDGKYFAKRSQEGRIMILKKESYGVRSPISLCFALTDNWTLQGKPIDRGIMPILQKLRYGDRGEQVLKELDQERYEQSRIEEKDRHNLAHDIADEMFYESKHAWKDINTSFMNKKGIKHGNY